MTDSSPRTHIASSIYEKIVRRCLESIPGVVTTSSYAHAGMNAVADKVTGATQPKIHIELQQYDNPAALPSCTVSLRIAVFWPCPLAPLIQCVQEAVVQHLRVYTDMIALRVDVDISSILLHPSQRLRVEDIEDYRQGAARPEPTPIVEKPLRPQPVSVPQFSGEGVSISSPADPQPITPWIRPEIVPSYSDLPTA